MYLRAGLDAVAKVVVAIFRNPKVGSRDLSFLFAFAKQL